VGGFKREMAYTLPEGSCSGYLRGTHYLETEGGEVRIVRGLHREICIRNTKEGLLGVGAGEENHLLTITQTGGNTQKQK